LPTSAVEYPCARRECVSVAALEGMLDVCLALLDEAAVA
jgi:hypothetical protein